MTDEEIKFTNNLISFSRQPELRRLVERIREPSCRVTLICGAGVTADAGLPTWHSLIRNLAELIRLNESEGIRAAILADEASLTRKADLILALLPNYHSSDDAIADALYSSREKNDYFGGQLATSIAMLSKALGSRCRIITTNYDDQIEESLREIGETRTIMVKGLPQELTGIDPNGNKIADRREVQRQTAAWLENNSTTWLDSLFSVSENTVLHLHGYISHKQERSAPGPSRIGPILLRESDYLEYGQQVQVLIEQAISTDNSITVFIGTSMTDPSIVGPLASTADNRRGRDIFCLLPSDGTESPEYDQGIPGQTAFSYRQGQKTYLDEQLGVSAILLKSYAQVSQVVMELCAAIDDSAAYLADDPESSIRYGFRFRRILESVHSIVGTRLGSIAPSDADSRALSDALDETLCATDGPLKYVGSIVKGYTATELGTYNLDPERMKQERFGLFLWLRQFIPDVGSTAEFTIFLVGSSAYAHRDGANLSGRVGWVLPKSIFSAARSVFLGQTVFDYLDFEQHDDARRPWRTFIAVPLECSESDLDIGGKSAYRVLVGSAVLHSTLRVVDRDALRRGAEETFDPREISQLSLLKRSQRIRLAQLTAAAGINAIQILQSRTGR
ncbi:SIR2 family protein [Nocardia mexicana]|uniref:SIR2-like protein n=1 Tax=Nocardia mexicana TaxID=279262 RepID=A0A370HAN0_9NOCA|nr:SIR2 family protein [Nocardia mexicana]RDI53988.1 SIR2-like protein [Nocardia mexicana]